MLIDDVGITCVSDDPKSYEIRIKKEPPVRGTQYA